MIVALKELGDISTGNTPSKKINEYYDSNDIYFVKPDIISDSEISIISNSSEYISEKARCKARIVPQNSIFVTCIGTIGKIGIASDGEFAFNQQINTIKPNDSIIPKYLAYNLFYSRSRLKAISNAPVVPIINKSQFSEFTINIETDRLKQQKIVSTLDILQSIITHRRTQLEKLDLLVKARFVEMFGDMVLNPNNFPVFTLQQLLDKKYITYHLDGNHGGDYPRSDEFVEFGVPYISANCIINGKINLSMAKYLTEERASKLRKGIAQNDDVLFAHNATVGPTAVLHTQLEKIILSTSLTAYRCNQEIINPNYLKSFMLSDGFIRQYSNEMKQTTRNQIPITTQRKYSFLIPPIDLQTQFADFVKQVDKSKATVQKALDEAQLLFDSLMQEYFG